MPPAGARRRVRGRRDALCRLAPSLALQRRRMEKPRGVRPDAVESQRPSLSGASDSSASLDLLSVALDAGQRHFLGVSVVGEGGDRGAGVRIGSIAEDGAVAADGRVRAGDVLIRVNEVSLENASSRLAAQVLRDVAQRPGPLSLTLLRLWEPAPAGLFALPKGEPVRPIDPASWVSHTAAVTGKLLPPYGEDEHLSVDGDMAAVVSAMTGARSGVAVRDRMWLKVLIPDAFTGADALGWLRRNVAGASGRADARRYAAELLERGFIRHAVNARGHKRFSAKRYYVVGDLGETPPPPPPMGHRDGGGEARPWAASSADAGDR